MNRLLIMFVCSTGMLFASGCAQSEMETTARGNPDQPFFTKLGHGSAAEVSLSQLALQKTTNPRVKQYAQRMVTDHTKINVELAQLAYRQHATAPKTLDKDHQRIQQTLMRLSGFEFDRRYIGAMLSDHRATLALLHNEATDGRDPAVRQFARQLIPVIAEHLKLAEQTEASLPRSPAPATTR